MYIFLDFDGVLRRNSSNPSRFEADCLANFEEAVRTIEGVSIVISSTWRLGYTLNEIRRMFSPDISSRIAGKTADSDSNEKHYRYGEVLAWLRKKAKGDEKWIVIDDDLDHFPAYCPQLITDPEKGFTKEDAKRLKLLFKE